MPKLNMSIRHQLPREEALTRIQRLLGEVKREQGDKISDLHEQWSGNAGNFSFKAAGFSVSGTLEVTSSEVRLNGNLPFAANFFKGKIENTIRQRAQQLLA
ncbi:MAG: polyhydroxyalkanoic acid system family protein [bacterium]|nr:polyhydroxyalkanoic acid system family protein [bacterium]